MPHGPFTRVVARQTVRPAHVNVVYSALENTPTLGEVVSGGSLTPGANGNIQATVGGVITSVKPGRIDARVRGLSTAASDNSTLLGTLLTESGSTGGELWIPDGTYRGTALVPANARIGGTGTLKPVAGGTGWVLSVTGNDVAVKGITVDCELTAKGLVFDGEFGTADKGYVVEGVTFRNHTDTSNAAVRYGQIADLVVRRCKFYTVGSAVGGYDSSFVRVEDNYADTTTGNAYGAISYVGGFRGCSWVRNVAINVKRMGIELWSTGPTAYLDAPEVADNVISLATTTTDYFNNMPYSIVAARDAMVHGNRAYGPVDAQSRFAAYELGVHPLRLYDNYATGMFDSGAILQAQSHSTVEGNTFIGQGTGITIQNASTQVAHTIRNNRIRGFRNKGIYLSENTGLHGAHVIEGNLIIHDAEWTGVTVWNGIEQYLGWPMAGKISRNTIIQGLAVPTSEGRGINIFINALGDMQGTEAHNNHFIDYATTPTATTLSGLTTKFGDAARMADVSLSGNRRTIATGVTNDVTTWVT